MTIFGRGLRWGVIGLSCVALLGVASCASVNRNVAINVASDVKGSYYYGKITKEQAAEMLQQIIDKGQNKKVLLRYVGMSPRIDSKVTIDGIEWHVTRFDHYGRTPDLPYGGNAMMDFKSAWKDVYNIEASIVSEQQIDSVFQYLAIYLGRKETKIGEPAYAELPLELKPAGYTAADVLLAFSVLMDKSPAPLVSTISISSTTTPVTAAEAPAAQPPVVTQAVVTAPTSAVANVATPAVATNVAQPTNTAVVPAASVAVTNATTNAPTAVTELPANVPTNAAVTLPPASPVVTNQPPADNQREIQLQKLKALHDKGLISEEVYNAKQSEILKGM